MPSLSSVASRTSNGSFSIYCDPACETLRRLLEPIHRGGAEEQEAAGAAPVPSSLVDQTPQFLKQLRHTMNFVEAH